MKERYVYDEIEDKLHVERTQDVEPVLEQVKIEKENIREIPGLGYKVGTIPAIIVQQYCNEVGITYREFCIDQTHIKRIMNDPDYRKFRVWEGNF